MAGSLVALGPSPVRFVGQLSCDVEVGPAWPSWSPRSWCKMIRRRSQISPARVTRMPAPAAGADNGGRRHDGNWARSPLIPVESRQHYLGRQAGGERFPALLPSPGNPAQRQFAPEPGRHPLETSDARRIPRCLTSPRGVQPDGRNRRPPAVSFLLPSQPQSPATIARCAFKGMRAGRAFSTHPPVPYPLPWPALRAPVAFRFVIRGRPVDGPRGHGSLSRAGRSVTCRHTGRRYGRSGAPAPEPPDKPEKPEKYSAGRARAPRPGDTLRPRPLAAVIAPHCRPVRYWNGPFGRACWAQRRFGFESAAKPVPSQIRPSSHAGIGAVRRIFRSSALSGFPAGPAGEPARKTALQFLALTARPRGWGPCTPGVGGITPIFVQWAGSAAWSTATPAASSGRPWAAGNSPQRGEGARPGGGGPGLGSGDVRPSGRPKARVTAAGPAGDLQAAGRCFPGGCARFPRKCPGGGRSGRWCARRRAGAAVSRCPACELGDWVAAALGRSR